MKSTFVNVLLCLCMTWIEAQNNQLNLRGASNLRGILYGTTIRVGNLRHDVDNGDYANGIRNYSQIVVPEGELKPRSIWRGENEYFWDDADFLLGAPNQTGWVQQNLMIIRGHNLVWAPDKWTPDWLVKNESLITPDKAKQLLSDYIHTVVSRYRGKILCWDVVNEAIDDQNNTNPLNLRNGFWFRKLGPDFIKYAFQFAHEADPNVQLYYNEYGIEAVGVKQAHTLNLVNWLRSEGVTIHGIGLQWHIDISVNVTPGDVHYQSAQQFTDNRLDIMVTELDISIPTDGGYPTNSQDLQTQANAFRAMTTYALHFSPHCKAMLTWGFTDRYSWIPTSRNYRRGASLPVDWLYLPKPAYYQILDVMAHVLADGVYRLSPQSQPNKCLGVSQNGSGNAVQLYSDSCEKDYQKWNITWQGDGTYRFATLNDNNRVLSTLNATATIGVVEMMKSSNNVNQGWAFSDQGNNIYRIVPHMAWWRVITVYNRTTDDIGIVDPHTISLHDWMLTKIF